MPSQKCRENIAKEPPPFNKPCSDGFCSSMSFEIGYLCSTRGKPASSPVQFIEPGLGECSCCCPDAASLAIAVGDDEFTVSTDLGEGDAIAVAGPDLRWRAGRVGHAVPQHLRSDIFVVYVMLIDDRPPLRAVNLVVALDHLFLTRDDKLKPAATLREGDEIRRADGGLARVSMASTALGGAPSPIVAADGAFDGRSLEGHLINTGGVVSADYAVQVAFAAGRLPADLLA